MWDEIHQLPDTDRAKDVWCTVKHPYRQITLSGSEVEFPLAVSIFSTSKATGWDLPREWEIIE